MPQQPYNFRDRPSSLDDDELESIPLRPISTSEDDRGKGAGNGNRAGTQKDAAAAAAADAPQAASTFSGVESSQPRLRDCATWYQRQRARLSRGERRGFGVRSLVRGVVSAAIAVVNPLGNLVNDLVRARQRRVHHVTGVIVYLTSFLVFLYDVMSYDDNRTKMIVSAAILSPIVPIGYIHCSTRGGEE